MGVGKNNPFAGNGLGNIAFVPDETRSTNLSGLGEIQPMGDVRGDEGPVAKKSGSPCGIAWAPPGRSSWKDPPL